jgi:hypothetical protein
MGPHPFAVSILTQDRSRAIEVELTQQQLLAESDLATPGQPVLRLSWIMGMHRFLSLAHDSLQRHQALRAPGNRARAGASETGLCGRARVRRSWGC